MPLERALCNSRRSSSIRATRRRPSAPKCRRSPHRTSSSMKPALPSKPTALPSRGPLKIPSMPASWMAPQMVGALLLEMIPRTRPASRRARRRGFRSGARSRSSTLLRQRTAMSPGEAVSVPSKSKRIAPRLPVRFLRSARTGSGEEGVCSRRKSILTESDEQEDGVAKLAHRGRVGGPQADAVWSPSGSSSPWGEADGDA
mmetsp:Transcript_53852/g.142003  ORF Transcript_53852/g.142003 Transcript_53852/m.142003 type:complete len:201 (-) Transcript_53852:556-1158(-)